MFKLFCLLLSWFLRWTQSGLVFITKVARTVLQYFSLSLWFILVFFLNSVSVNFAPRSSLGLHTDSGVGVDGVHGHGLLKSLNICSHGSLPPLLPCPSPPPSGVNIHGHLTVVRWPLVRGRFWELHDGMLWDQQALVDTVEERRKILFFPVSQQVTVQQIWDRRNLLISSVGRCVVHLHKDLISAH